MSVFSRIFAKAEDSAEPEKEISGDEEFRKKFVDFVRSRKGSQRLMAALDKWDQENGNCNDPDFITQEEKQKILLVLLEIKRLQLRLIYLKRGLL